MPAKPENNQGTQKAGASHLALEGHLALSQRAWEEIGRGLNLSGREREILIRLFENHTENMVAGELGISSRTVHAHMERLYRKVKVNNRTQLVRRVMWEFVRLSGTEESGLPPICARHAAGECPLKGRR